MNFLLRAISRSFGQIVAKTGLDKISLNHDGPPSQHCEIPANAIHHQCWVDDKPYANVSLLPTIRGL